MSKKPSSDRVAYITERQQVAVYHWKEEENKIYCRAVVHILNLGNVRLGLCDMCRSSQNQTALSFMYIDTSIQLHQQG